MTVQCTPVSCFYLVRVPAATATLTDHSESHDSATGTTGVTAGDGICRPKNERRKERLIHPLPCRGRAMYDEEELPVQNMLYANFMSLTSDIAVKSTALDGRDINHSFLMG